MEAERNKYEIFEGFVNFYFFDILKIYHILYYPSIKDQKERKKELYLCHYIISLPYMFIFIFYKVCLFQSFLRQERNPTFSTQYIQTYKKAQTNNIYMYEFLHYSG